MKYHFKIRKEETGYSAHCIELEGCLTQADSMKELYENMKEALILIWAHNSYIFTPSIFQK